MKSSKQSDLCFCGAPYKQKATNKNLELELAFASIDNELKQLGESQDPKQVKRSVPDIRSQLFEVYNLAVYNLDIRKFASPHDDNHDDKTPSLNSQEEF
jgi:hypothetical protein